ncbi:MAG: tripartite tricarboxylate transporter substrate binding protein [Candidatus Accumulibacter sp.]|jgi:tripartite-type tricarboxylate transporter receptor subunit TctC|nr:tripartite tricarboxylate transporter substrate binding protein [Accumulibacter sp.]
MPTTFSRRAFLRRTVAAFTAGTLSGLAPAAPAWPRRAITLVVPWPAGGDTDFHARVLAARLGARLGQNIVVENHPGENGVYRVAKSKPDGYTLLFAGSSLMVDRFVFSEHPPRYHPLRDFVFVSVVLENRGVLLAHASLGVANFDELLVRARDTRKPPLAFSGSGFGEEFAMEHLARHHRIYLVKELLPGARSVLEGLRAGRTQIGVLNFFLAAGESDLVPLLVMGTDRLPEIPDVPTTHEHGLKGIDLQHWEGVFAPALTPADVVDRLSEAIGEVIADEEYRRLVNKNGNRAIFQPDKAAAMRLGKAIEARQRYIKSPRR